MVKRYCVMYRVSVCVYNINILCVFINCDATLQACAFVGQTSSGERPGLLQLISYIILYNIISIQIIANLSFCYLYPIPKKKKSYFIVTACCNKTTLKNVNIYYFHSNLVE